MNNLEKAYLVYRRVGDFLRKRYHTADAKKNTTTVLSVDHRRKVEEFWKPYCKVNPLFHAFYTEKTGEFHAEYMPDDIYYTLIDPYYNDWHAAAYMDNKCMYQRYFGSAVKYPRTVLMRENGFWYDAERRMLSHSAREEIIRSYFGNNKLFIKKAEDSAGGAGVVCLDCSKDGDSVIRKFNDIVNRMEKDIIVQEAIEQHSALSKLNTSSVNTVRLISLLSQDGVKIYSCVLRMGISGMYVDNASSGGVTCGICDNGRLKQIGFSANGKRFDDHPTSKLHFDDIVVPSFAKTKELVQKLHPMIPHFRLASWDFAIDKNGDPILIEVNLKYGELDFHQLNNGPLFGKDTVKILDEVFHSKK